MWAKDGLPHDDCFWQVYHNLCVWFYFVELFDLPPDGRQKETLRLLISHAEKKSNGFISNSEPIPQRMERLVLHTIKNVQDKFVMARIRTKRTSGEYRSVYYLADNMLSENAEAIEGKHDHSSPSVSTSLHVGAFSPDLESANNIQVPELREWIERHYKQEKIRVAKKTIDKLVRFVNWLSQNRFKAMLNVERLKAFGFGDGRQRKHLEHLESMKGIHRFDYCPEKGIARTFSVRKEVRNLYYEHARKKSA